MPFNGLSACSAFELELGVYCIYVLFAVLPHKSGASENEDASTEIVATEEAQSSTIFGASTDTHTATTANRLGLSLAESILFPPHEDFDSSSEEESDWIVSDGEADYVDLKEMLKETAASSDVQGKILYHLEGESNDVLASGPAFQELDFLPLPLIEAVCGDGGVEAIKEVIKADSDAYTLDVADDKGKLGNVLHLWQACLNLCAGYTAVMYAVEKGDNISLKVLLEAGASIDCKVSSNGVCV